MMPRDPASSQAPAVHDVATWLTRLPKAELHVHVVGAIRPTTLATLAAHHGPAGAFEPICAAPHIGSNAPAGPSSSSGKQRNTVRPTGLPCKGLITVKPR